MSHTCTACGTVARKTVHAIVTRGPGVAVPGDVCGPCAATGVLIVVGDDRAVEDPPQAPVTPQEPTRLPALQKVGLGIRTAPTAAPAAKTKPKGLSPREAAVLGVVVHLGGVTRRQITTLTGIRRRNRDNVVSMLHVLGFITTDSTRIEPTAKAMALASSLPAPVVGRPYAEKLMRELPGREAEIITVLTEAPLPVIVPREEITRRTGMLRRNRDNVISKLRGLELVDANRSGITAAPELFG